MCNALAFVHAHLRSVKTFPHLKPKKMTHIEIIKMKAEADAKHLQAKLNEVEADALDGIAKYQKKSNELQLEVDMSKKKRAVLKEKLEQLKLANASTWEKVSNEFVESIESLEDKNIFKTKTDEWFKTIRNIASGLKEDIKEKVAQ